MVLTRQAPLVLAFSCCNRIAIRASDVVHDLVSCLSNIAQASDYLFDVCYVGFLYTFGFCEPQEPPTTQTSTVFISRMSRGNQRDTDRARAQKRAEKAGKASAKEKDGLTAAQRRERDAKALQEKLARKQGST